MNSKITIRLYNNYVGFLPKSRVIEGSDDININNYFNQSNNCAHSLKFKNFQQKTFKMIQFGAINTNIEHNELNTLNFMKKLVY